MSNDPGKRFEEDIRDSVPADMWYYRFRDGTANFQGQKNENTRFQQTNICDCQLYYYGLFLLELKSHNGKSLPHSQFKDAKGKIKHLYELVAAQVFGIVAGVIINMREVEETYWLPANVVLNHILNSGIKSIPIAFMRENGYRLKAEKKKVRYRYDIKDLIANIRLER
jgi:recombination protein U